ncbi:MAG: hypothetical protein ABTR07_05890 [Candidatus Competibacter denitrificans]
MRVATLPTAQNTILSTSKIELSILAHDCYEQLDAMALLAGTSNMEPSISGAHWMMLLNPIVEQLRLLTILIDRNRSTADLCLVDPEASDR